MSSPARMQPAPIHSDVSYRALKDACTETLRALNLTTEQRDKSRGRELELALHLKAMIDQSKRLRVWRACLIAALITSQATIAILLRWL